MLRGACALLLVVACEGTCNIDGTTCKYWSYAASGPGQNAQSCGTSAATACGPEFWSSTSSGSTACAALAGQSPINQDTKKAVLMPNSNGVNDFQLKSPITSCAITANFQLNGHSRQVDIPDSCKKAFTATWKSNGVSKVYNLHQYEFHHPSEHTIDGAYLDMEAHHLHKAADNTYLILAVFLKADPTLKARCTAKSTTTECKRANFLNAIFLGGQTESQLTTAAAAVAGPQTKLSHAAAVDFDPYKGYVPLTPALFYTYTGSFTAPPCTAGVTWILNPEHVLIYDTSLAMYKKITVAFKDNQLRAGSSNRAIQPIDNRKLYYVGKSPDSITTTPPATTTPAGTSTPSATQTPSAKKTVRLYSQLDRIARRHRTRHPAVADVLWLAAGSFIAVGVFSVIRFARSRTSQDHVPVGTVAERCAETDEDELE